MMLVRTPVPDAYGFGIRAQASLILRELTDVVEDHHRLQLIQDSVRLKIAAYVTGEAENGLDRVGAISARVGPSLLAELRADEDLVASIVDKAHMQDVYISELKRGLQQLESIRDDLDTEVRRRQ